MERCPRCRMVQYLTALNRSRRCYLSLVVPVAPRPSRACPRGLTWPPENPLRGWRRIRGLTQKQLAVGARLPRTYVSRIENGRIIPGLVTLERVADALKVVQHCWLPRLRMEGLRATGTQRAWRGETAMGTVLALRHLPQTAVLLHPRRWMRRTVSRKSCNPAAC